MSGMLLSLLTQLARAALVTVCSITAVLTTAAAQVGRDSNWEKINPAIERFDIELPMKPVAREWTVRALEELTREPCDKAAIKTLAKALENGGLRRNAAKAYMRFSETCNGHSESLQLAANLYLTISDYQEAAKAATEFIKLEPLNDNGYFLRAVAYDRGNEAKKAIDDYISAIELFQPKAKIADVSYVGLARNYEKVGAPCDAARAIEGWVALNPSGNDTPRSRALIQSYLQKGNCPASAAAGEDVFPTARQNGVIVIPVTVNGVRGRFMVDTGASFSGMKLSFAQKAKVQFDRDSVVKLSTANGIGEGMRGQAASIQLKTLERKDILVIVQTDAKGSYGDGVDGLLGMNFLSHYLVTIDSKNIRIRTRAQR